MPTAHAHGAGEVPCPDPSVHEQHNKLADQASTAALYVTNPKRQSQGEVLGKDGKLSASSKWTLGVTSAQQCLQLYRRGSIAQVRQSARPSELPDSGSSFDFEFCRRGGDAS